MHCRQHCGPVASQLRLPKTQVSDLLLQRKGWEPEKLELQTDLEVDRGLQLQDRDQRNHYREQLARVNYFVH